MDNIINEICDAYQKKLDANEIKRTRRHDRIIALENSILEKKDTLDRLLEIGKAIASTDFTAWKNKRNDCSFPIWADTYGKGNLGFRNINFDISNMAIAVYLDMRYESDSFSDELVAYDGELLHIGYERHDAFDHKDILYDYSIDRIIDNASDYNRAIKALTTFRDSITAFDSMITPMLSEYVDYCNNYYNDVTKGVI